LTGLKSFLVLVSIASATLIGDYFIKRAAMSPAGIRSPELIAGALLYGLTAIGWFHLMKSQSLAMIAVTFTASTVIALSALGFFVFGEQFGRREALGVTFAVLAVMMVYKG
jgi:drug/metabolite transporter (DMT)-like permease